MANGGNTVTEPRKLQPCDGVQVQAQVLYDDYDDSNLYDGVEEAEKEMQPSSATATVELVEEVATAAR